MDPRLYPQLRELERTHWWFVGRRAILRAALERVDARPRSILDVGCGAGSNLEFLGERFAGASLSGMDLAAAALRFCREDRGLPVCRADAASLPFCSGAFDLVTALDLLEHVEDDASALGHLLRVCRPGGRVVLTVPALRLLWGNVDTLGHHHRRYAREELREKVEAAGFEVSLLRFVNFLLFPPIAAVRLLSRALPGPDPEGDARSDFDWVKSGPLNRLLARVFSLEASLLGWRAPVGVSLLCVATRSGGGAGAGSD